jgi:hypothetical protein
VEKYPKSSSFVYPLLYNNNRNSIAFLRNEPITFLHKVSNKHNNNNNNNNNNNSAASGGRSVGMPRSDRRLSAKLVTTFADKGVSRSQRGGLLPP